MLRSAINLCSSIIHEIHWGLVNKQYWIEPFGVCQLQWPWLSKASPYVQSHIRAPFLTHLYLDISVCNLKGKELYSTIFPTLSGLSQSTKVRLDFSSGLSLTALCLYVEKHKCFHQVAYSVAPRPDTFCFLSTSVTIFPHPSHFLLPSVPFYCHLRHSIVLLLAPLYDKHNF